MSVTRVCALLAPAVLAAALLAAAPPSRDAFDARIGAELEALNPGAALVWNEANAAREAEDHEKAAALYAEVITLAPDFVHAKRRQAGEEHRLGHRKKALSLAREALAADRSPENMVGLAMVLARASGKEEPRDAEKKEAFRLATEAATLAPDDFHAQAALAELALQNQDEKRLAEASDRLLEIAPDEVATHHVATLRAAVEGRWDDASASLERAHELGLPDEDYGQMKSMLKQSRPMTAGLLSKAAWAGGLWAGALLALLGVGTLLSGAVLREAEVLPGQASGKAQGGGASLKKAYSIVLWLSCAFYYVSLPLVALSVVLAGGGILYGIFALGRIPVKLVLLVVIVVLVTLWSMLKSIFVRGTDEDPGQRLDLPAHPRLRGLLGDVARRVGTRPVDNVYLTPGTELAVMERGGMGAHLRGQAERCLILGVGVLEGLKIGPLKAVLAHEYGHFSNRDTAGGGFALAVRRSLITMAQNLGQAGAAAWYNPAWVFLNVFYRVFLRISQGASRLQEILADRWAAFTYGSKAFEDGLRHVIEQSVRFDVRAGAALQDMAAHGVSNLYQHQPERPAAEEEVEKAVREALNRPASPYDSHPSPTERSRWVRALAARGAAQSADDVNEAWSLFQDRAAIEESMTRHVQTMVQAAQEAQAAAEA